MLLVLNFRLKFNSNAAATELQKNMNFHTTTFSFKLYQNYTESNSVYIM